jgi:serine/threonine protein kinase
MIGVGHTVGNYRLTATLGAGGMGTVFLAEHPVIGSKVALKAIHPQFAGSTEAFARFVNEAKAVNQIGHDHIIDITDFGTTATGDSYFMMEYLEGDSLSGAIRRDGPFPPERALNIAAQIADALDASHNHGVIHRDLKPENVFLIVRDGLPDFVKVLDFGLAKLTNPDDLATYESRAGAVMGTPYYMAPEQCEGQSDIDGRADVYALGVILFEMLTGMVPFGGDGFVPILVKHVTVPPPAARSIVSGLPASMDSILFRSLAKNPMQRFQTMTAFREALLDPERYGASDPAPSGSSPDLAARVRQAKPMARRAEGRAPLEDPGLGQSTFRDSAGEVWTRDDSTTLIARTHHLRTILIVGALAGALTAGVKYRHQTTRFLDGAASMTSAVKKRAAVRVTFDSDPQGAAVDHGDGTALGVTPFSMDLPYSDVATEYSFRKTGYVTKVVPLVRNRPSPLFAGLRKEAPAPPAEPAAPVSELPSVAPDAPPPPKSPAPMRRRHAETQPALAPPGEGPVATEPERDDTMAPRD